MVLFSSSFFFYPSFKSRDYMSNSSVNSFGQVIGQIHRLNLKFKLYFGIGGDFFFLYVVSMCFNALSAIIMCKVFWSFILLYAFSLAFKHRVSKMEELSSEAKSKVPALLRY